MQMNDYIMNKKFQNFQKFVQAKLVYVITQEFKISYQDGTYNTWFRKIFLASFIYLFFY